MYGVFDQLLGKCGDEQMQILLARMHARKGVAEVQKQRSKVEKVKKAAAK